MWKLILIFLAGSLIEKIYSLDCSINSDNEEYRLKKILFCYGYDPNVRPVKNHSVTTVISTKMIVKGFSFDSDESTLTVNAWLVKRWKDEYLVWDPRDYGNIKSFDESPDLIWTPQLNLYNSRISYGLGSCHPTNCIIYSNSPTNVACVDPCTFVGQCKTDYTRWPFDIQNCTLHFGSWMNLVNELDFNVNKTTIESKKAAKNSKWKLVGTSARKVVTSMLYKSGKEVRIPSIKYNVVIERHSQSKAVMVFAPAVIFIMLNLLSLYVSPDTWDRPCLITISITTHFNFMLLITWYIPYNGENVPSVYIFYRDSLIITGLLLIETLLMRRLWTSEELLPKWMEICINKMRSTKITEIFIIKKIINNPEIEQEDQQDDATILVEELKENSKQNEMWKFFVKFFDRVLMLAVFLTYLIMMVLLLPSGYFIKNGVTYEQT